MLIHLGYHKTATTWLQQYYFPCHSQIDFVGKHEELWSQIISPHGFDFDVEIARAFFYPKLESARCDNLFPVFSSERLSGNPHSGGYDSKIIADRLKQVFPDSKILIVIRKQDEAILSSYKQYIKVGGICTLREYLHPPRDGRIPLFRLEHWQYHKLIDYYAQLYGKTQIQVLCYEQFKQSPRQFLTELAGFMGISDEEYFPMTTKINESLSDLAILLKRRINRWHGNDSLYPITPKFPKYTQSLWNTCLKFEHYPRIQKFNAHFSECIQDTIGDFYAKSNRYLSEQYQLDLKRYDYRMS